jgi:Predicted endonuclease containing a URI domain
MTVHLLHFTQSLPRGISPSGTALQAGHYLGYTENLIERIMAHAEGHGARLTQVAKERGIDFRLARTWDGANRTFERMLKTRVKNGRRLCPICNPKALNCKPSGSLGDGEQS